MILDINLYYLFQFILFYSPNKMHCTSIGKNKLSSTHLIYSNAPTCLQKVIHITATPGHGQLVLESKIGQVN